MLRCLHLLSVFSIAAALLLLAPAAPAGVAVPTVAGPTLASTALHATASRADEAADRAALLEGVTEVESVGSPGPVVVFGERAFAVLTGPSGEALVGAAHFGEGRVVAFGHGGYCGAGGEPDSGRARLLANALAWAAGGSPEPVVVELRRGVDLAGAEVLLWGGGKLPERDQAAVRDFVEAGGGLVIGQCPWGWQQLNPRRALRDDAPVNRITAPMGLAFGPTILRGPFRVADSRPDAAHAGRAADAVVRGEGVALPRILERAATSLPTADPLLLPRLEALVDRGEAPYPTPSAPLKAGDALGRLAVALWQRRFAGRPQDEPGAAPGAEAYPGAVPPDAERATERLELDGGRHGWRSTGLYLAPGEVLTARVLEGEPRGWGLRVGCHKDSIAGKDTWSRWPSISRREDLAVEGETRLASPFGGLVYVEVPADAPSARLELAGGVRAPWFDLREPLDAEGWRRARSFPGPWAEIGGEHLVLTVPSSSVRDLEDPAAVARFWDEVMVAHHELARRPLPRRPERFVADVQISNGYMHAGYPIMMHLDVAEPRGGRPARMLDVERLRSEGSWGHFHELGHNLQRSWWTFQGTGEVTCNLFALHALDRVCGIEPWEAEWLSKQKRKGPRHLARGAPFASWKKDPGLALLMYAELQRELGWEPYYRAFAAYEAAPKEELPRDDDAERDQWLVRLSQGAERDLGPFFERWGVPVSAEARAAVAELEVWLPEEPPEGR